MDKRLCIFLALIFNSLFSGEIITTNNFSLIEKEATQLDASSLMLFDVDGTLIIPKDAILNPKGRTLFNELIASYRDRDLFREIRMQASHALVNGRSIHLMHKLQNAQIPVIAFTAAPSVVKGVEEAGIWRVHELKRYGLDFSLAFPKWESLTLPKNENYPYAPMFKLGVLYSSFHPKGDILALFLKQIALKPKKVIFVDDEFEHVQSVVTCLDKEDIPCVGIYYTAANEIPCNVNKDLAQFQINYFIEHAIWLSDLEAKQMIHKGLKK